MSPFRPQTGGWRRLTLVALAGVASLASLAAQPQPVAIFYDGETRPMAQGYLDARHIENLLGHFGLRAEVRPIGEYRAGELAHYRAAFFTGTVTGTRFPAGFLADVRAFPRPFCWIGRHIGQLTAAAALGFRYVDYRDDLEFRQVLYKGATLPKDDPDLNIVAVEDAAAVQVLATAVNDENTRHPYALRRNRFWYFADSPFSYALEGSRYLVFCDLLHDILEIDHPPEARALARIEDVSAEIDPADLRQIADRLGARRVPFQIAVIPIYRNPAKNQEIYLSDRPDLVAAIQHMISRGGTAILHGVTHQYRGVTGDDHEFWDDLGNRPIAQDLAELVLRRVQLGLAECFANGIIPLAFETPHYAASETDYRTLQGIFSLFNERTMATPDAGSIQYFPYPVVDRFGRYVVPENLGYLPLEDPDPKVILEHARNLRVVRDAVASFYFHPFLNPALLETVVAGLERAGYRFVSLREFGGGVDYRGRYVVRSSSGTARVALEDEYWRLRVYESSGKLAREELAPGRRTGLTEVEARVPAGGWAAIDCLKELPKTARRDDPAGWWSRLREWWSRRSAPEAGAAAPSAADRRAWIVWLEAAAGGDARNQQSYRTALETFGYKVDLVRLPEFREAPRENAVLLAIPGGAGSRLSESQQQAARRYLEAGGSLVTDSPQGWLAPLGFRFAGRRIAVASVVDVLFPQLTLQWLPEEQVERFAAPAEAQVLAVDVASKQPLAVGGRHGAGRYVYLAAPLDPHTPDASSHYPYFPEYLAETFRLRPAGRSARLEVYFDPGFREGMNLERLAARWRQRGIRTVYVAAWHFYPRYTFDYDHLVRLCHRNGLAVYAWFIFPAVTPRLWEEHPEWRERAASGADGRAGWRHAMNLENPACFRASVDWMKSLLQAHPWDGVNLTELNYDADFEDYLRPDRFVPMNDEVRAGFRAESGFDPAQLFAPASRYHHKRNPRGLEQFLRYREDIVTGWHRRLLGELEPLGRSRGWELMVTMLDSLHSAYVQPALGVNSRRIAALMKEFDFTLQVEDPAEHWTGSPDRYRRFAETYRQLVPDARRLMFDINVMPNRSVAGTSLPSATATGIELARTVEAAASASGRVAIYSEYTVSDHDWSLLGAGQGREANGGALVDLSAELLKASEKPTGVTVRYRSPGRAVLVLNQKPLEIRVDGRKAELPLESAPGGHWTVLAPRGEHEIEAITLTQAGILVRLWSEASASTITAFGAISTLGMAAIYLALRMRRLARRGGAP